MKDAKAKRAEDSKTTQDKEVAFGSAFSTEQLNTLCMARATDC